MARVMALYVREASRVFQRTTFLEDSTAPEGVRMAILSVTTYLTEAEMKTFGNGKTKLVNRYLGVSSVLEEFSKVSSLVTICRTLWCATTVKLGYSPPLLLHHFGSLKWGLGLRPELHGICGGKGPWVVQCA